MAYGSCRRSTTDSHETWSPLSGAVEVWTDTVVTGPVSTPQSLTVTILISLVLTFVINIVRVRHTGKNGKAYPC